MAKDEEPREVSQKRPISPSVFDHVLQAGIDHANALDLDEPELRLPARDVRRRPAAQDDELPE